MSAITDIRLISSLEKIYDEDKMPEKSLERFSVLKNEKKSFQVAVEASAEGDASVTMDTDLILSTREKVNESIKKAL